jgi:hypothetical protein
MPDQHEILPTQNLANFIRVVREVRVILDADLAKIYGVETRVLNQPSGVTGTDFRMISRSS